MPDPVCTPGATDPRVIRDNIQSTICVTGNTETVRPPSSYTTNLKIIQLQEYGLTLTVGEVEEDHLIPLELGGGPRDPRNLWPEPYGGEREGARDKDEVENALHREVCAGRLSLAEAQRRIAIDWTTALDALTRLTPAPSPATSAPAPPPPSAAAACSPAYPTVCIPLPPPDLDCNDIAFRNFKVLPPDPHRFDADHDGIGCKS